MITLALMLAGFAQAQTLEEAVPAARAAIAQSPLQLSEEARAEAAALLQGTTKDGRLPEGSLRAIAREIAAVRAASPENAALKPFEGRRFDELTLEASPVLMARLGPRWVPGKDASLTIPAPSGDAGLDRALSGLSPREFEVERYGNQLNITIRFSGPIDLQGVSLYDEGLSPLDRSGLIMIGSPSSTFRRVEKPGETLYVIGQAEPGADCMAGCLQRYRFYRIVSGINGPEAVEVKPRNPWMSVAGYPARFPARAFSDYAELKSSLKDADWSVRLHAACTLRMIAGGGRTGLGEDEYPDEPSEKARVKAIFDAAAKDGDAAEKLLEGVASSDPDEQVRRAAEYGCRR